MISTPLPATIVHCAVFAFVSAVPARLAPEPLRPSSPMSPSSILAPIQCSPLHGCDQRNRITFVSRSAAVPLAKNTHVIDGRGQFLIPDCGTCTVHSLSATGSPADATLSCRCLSLTASLASAIWAETFRCSSLGATRSLTEKLSAAYDYFRADAGRLLPDGKLRFPSSIAVATPQARSLLSTRSKRKASTSSIVQSVISHDAYLAACCGGSQGWPPTVGTCQTKCASRKPSPPDKKASST